MLFNASPIRKDNTKLVLRFGNYDTTCRFGQRMFTRLMRSFKASVGIRSSLLWWYRPAMPVGSFDPNSNTRATATKNKTPFHSFAVRLSEEPLTCDGTFGGGRHSAQHLRLRVISGGVMGPLTTPRLRILLVLITMCSRLAVTQFAGHPRFAEKSVGEIRLLIAPWPSSTIKKCSALFMSRIGVEASK